jgi:Flp pilus assembly protein TadB
MIDEMRQMILMMLFLLGMIWVANALFVWTVKRRKRNRRVSVTPP